jgi:co-chaperonin GroES (HSP10)
MKLINGNALVEVIKKDNVLSSGLIITESVVDDEGIIIEVDPNVAHIVNIGDRVRFNPNNAHDFTHNGKACKFIKVFDENSPITDITFKYGE